MRTARSKLLKCYYCEKKLEPDYKDFEDIGRYVSDRARIVGRDRSGLCAKHQKRLAIAIKRARHLGLLPFKVAI
ncbi:30S ribosomal protein S18 [Candidatus Woesebacteria bacterium]|nr:30S ribosomal protein S18 [Candidatus Woesebacteria bacterium]